MSDAVSEVLAASSLYEVLGVNDDASSGEIKAAYRRRVLRCHPDKCPGNDNAAEAFDKIHKAFGVLGDAKRRGDYDITGLTTGSPTQLEEEEERMVRGILIRLSCIITIPEDELLDDFVTFVRKLSEDDVISEIVMSSTIRGCLAGLATALLLPLSPLGFSIILALGPAALGPAIAWERILADFDGLTIGGRTVTYPLQTAYSMTRTTVKLTVMWSALCVYLSAHVVAAGAAYTYNMATVLLSKNATYEELDEWFLITFDESSGDGSLCASADTGGLELYPENVSGSEWIVVNVRAQT